MTTIRFAALAVAAMLVSAPAAAQESPVVGTWDTQAVTDFGTFRATVTIAEGDGGYSVTIVDAPAEGMPAMASTISNVVVDGASFSFTRSLTSPQGPMTLTYTGNVDGDALTATVASDFGNIPVTGTRAQ